MHTLYAALKRYWKLCLLVVILATVNQLFSLLDPLIFQHIIDDYASKFDHYTAGEFFRGVSFLLLLVVGTAFVSRVAKNFQDFYLNKVVQRSGADMYQAGVRHALGLPYAVFEDTRSGETLGVLQKARSDSEKYLLNFINIAFVSFVGLVFVIIYATIVHWSIGVVYLSLIPILGGVIVLLTGKVKKIQSAIVVETTALAGSTTESLRNIELVKSLGLAEQEIDRLNTTTEKILALELKKLKYVRSIDFIQGTLINLIRTLLMLFLLYLVFTRTISFGQFFSLYIYSFYVMFPLQQLGLVITSFREAQASLAEYEKITSIPLETLPSSPQPIGPLETLSFNNVSFSYKSAQTKALDDVSFELAKGQTIAFVGPSGSGKTSLVKLLVGLYDPSEGEVKYNSVSGSLVDRAELRSQIGFVTQDTQLFAGTIKENLLFVEPSATDEEMMDVLNKSASHSLLARADKGLDTVIGEGGVKISGGEKQRLSIARALLRKPALLVFDEATSALDSLTEEEITATVRSLAAQQAHLTVLIAHRLSTVMHADRIYVLEKGVIAESGTHEELIASDGLYHAMWRQQIGER